MSGNRTSNNFIHDFYRPDGHRKEFQKNSSEDHYSSHVVRLMVVEQARLYNYASGLKGISAPLNC